MLAKRIIPCLDIRDGQTVKGINFVGLKQVGDPVELGAKYAAEGADELVYLDISASEEGRRTFTELVSRIAARIDIPFTVGGGISSVDDAGRLLDAGADKVTLNSAAVADPALIDAIAAKYGSQFVVAAIDARTVGDRWVVTTQRPSTVRASMAATTNCEPYLAAMASISAGLATAALLRVILSAPASSSLEASSTDEMPPPTVNGMSMRAAMRATSSVKVRRPSSEALMSR